MLAKTPFRRLPLILIALAVIAALGLLSGIVTQGFEDLATAKAEKRRLEEERVQLQRRIERLSEMIDVVDNDPEAVESIARHDLGWIGPGEEVIVLATPTPIPPLRDLTDEGADPILRLP
jgi:cell division protein FtsB